MSSTKVRAFGFVSPSDSGKLQQDKDNATPAQRQFANTGDSVDYSEISSGKTFKHPDIYMASDFQGRSGQPDNQDIHRAKGST